MKVFVVLSVVLAVATAAPGINNVQDGDTNTIRKAMANCLNSEDTITCLSVKGITALSRAARSANIDILPGVSFSRYDSNHLMTILILLKCISNNTNGTEIKFQ